LLQEPDKSFIVYHETNPFTLWHHHPEYELVLITKGKGRRLVGDHVERFEEYDLVLVGSYLPHEWLCDDVYFDPTNGFRGEGIVIQFLIDFLGTKFFEVPENKNLRQRIEESSRGLKFYGKTKDNIISIMMKIIHLNVTDRLFSLFTIFKILSKTSEYILLCSPGFMEPFHAAGNEPMQKTLQHILQNFQKDITIKELLAISNMSNTTFCAAFKKTYRMTFKEYLLNIRIGYACRLLGDETLKISEIAYQSGFENLSNFNRQFKRIKGVTPKDYRIQIEMANLQERQA
jgi:AraC-like DNA-binding protein